MPNETDPIIVSRSVEEDKGTSGVVQEVFAAENCSAECPTCQQSCALTAGHAGLHHCENGHDWISSLPTSDEEVLLPSRASDPGVW